MRRLDADLGPSDGLGLRLLNQGWLKLLHGVCCRCWVGLWRACSSMRREPCSAMSHYFQSSCPFETPTGPLKHSHAALALQGTTAGIDKGPR